MTKRKWLTYAVGFLPAILLLGASFVGFDVVLIDLGSFPAILLSLGSATAVWYCLGWGRALAVLTLSMLLIISVARTHWPLRLAFAASKPAFANLADRLESGEEVSPQWAGFFYVRKAEMHRGQMPVLWINLQAAGYTGFARPADDVAIGKYNDWSDYRLWGNWHLIAED